MRLEFMDPTIVQKLLEGHADIIGAITEERDKFYAEQTCPRCGGNCRKLGDYHTMHTGEEALPKFYLQCLACGEEFDPHTGITLKLGNEAKAMVPAFPLLEGPED